MRDTDAGHRIFLGADPLGAAELCAALGPSLKLSRRRDQDPTGAFAAWALLSLSRDPSAAVQDSASRAVEPTPSQRPDRDDALARTALRGAVEARDRRAMIEAAADAVANELSGGLAAAQLAIVAPYVDGVLRFALDAALASRGIRLRTHRRHLPLRESPWVRAGLSLVALASPSPSRSPRPWPPRFPPSTRSAPRVWCGRSTIGSPEYWPRPKGWMLGIARASARLRSKLTKACGPGSDGRAPRAARPDQRSTPAIGRRARRASSSA